MSYFLEDTKKFSGGSKVLVDYTGMNEAMLNAEVAWHSIVEEAMIKEYSGIKNESMSLIREAKDSFFEKVKNWFKSMIQAIARIVTNIKNKILLKMDFYGKFAIRAEKKIKKAGSNYGKNDVKSYNLSSLKTIDDDSETIMSNIEKSINDITKKDKETIKGIKEKRDTEYENLMKSLSKLDRHDNVITKASYSKALEFTKDLKSSKGDINHVLLYYKTASEECKKGLTAAEREDKEKVNAAKVRSSLINSLSSRYLNIRMKILSIKASFIKDCIKATGSTEVDDLTTTTA
jgi:hypothetical protein